MAGHTPWREIQARRGPVTPARQATRDAYGRAMDEAQRIARAQEAGAARVEVADLPTSDPGARRDDLYFAALRGYVEELGGRLVLTAVFPEGVAPPAPAADATQDGHAAMPVASPGERDR